MACASRRLASLIGVLLLSLPFPVQMVCYAMFPLCLSVHMHAQIEHTDTQRQRERERHTHRDTDTQTDRHTHTHTRTHTHRQTDTHTHTQVLPTFYQRALLCWCGKLSAHVARCLKDFFFFLCVRSQHKTTTAHPSSSHTSALKRLRGKQTPSHSLACLQQQTG